MVGINGDVMPKDYVAEVLEGLHDCKQFFLGDGVSGLCRVEFPGGETSGRPTCNNTPPICSLLASVWSVNHFMKSGNAKRVSLDIIVFIWSKAS